MANLQRVNTKQMTHEGQNTVYDLMNQIAGENLIINGNFDVWQRGNSSSAYGYGSADRWMNVWGGTTCTLSAALLNGLPSEPIGSRAHIRATVSSVTGAANVSSMGTRLENLKFFLNRTFTLSFWAKADAPKNMSFDVSLNYGQGAGIYSPGEAGIHVKKFALTTEWKKYTTTFTVPSGEGKTFGSNDNLTLYFFFDAGTNFAARTDNLGHQSGVFDIAQVKLEEGSVATPFRPRSFDDEIRLCERYYQLLASARYSFGFQGYNLARQKLSQTILFRTRMRTTPTVVLPSLETTNVTSSSANAPTQFGFLLVAVVTATGYASILSSGATSGYADAEL